MLNSQIVNDEVKYNDDIAIGVSFARGSIMSTAKKSKIEIDPNELKMFLNESYETLNSLDRELITLGKNPDAVEILNTIHANYKTFLDSSKFFGFNKLESLAHIGEKLVRQLINSEYEITGEIITIILKLNFGLRDIIFHIEENGSEPNVVASSMVSDIEEVIKKHEPENQLSIMGSGEEASDDDIPTPEIPVPLIPAFGNSETLEDMLNTLVSLFHVREQLFNFRANFRDINYSLTTNRLGLLMDQLYQKIHKAKSQPLSNLVSHFDKITRDLSKALKKDIQLVIEGKEKEIDIQLLEVLRESLVHIMKNSIQHGIESPEERTSVDKSPTGEIIIQARYVGELFHIKVIDDGRGIDPNKIRKRLIEKDLLLTDEVDRLSENEIVEYIFKSGLNSNTSSSNYSSSPGLDIVRTNIEKVGGRIYIEKNIPGKGVEILISLPLINAIVPVIVVACGNERYAISRLNLIEIVQIDSDKLLDSLEFIKGSPIYKHKNQSLPLLYLKQILRYEEIVANVKEDEQKIVSILVLDVNHKKFGLVADKVVDMQDIVIKALGYQIKDIRIFSGVTILNDEQVSLILDIHEISRIYSKKVDLFKEEKPPEPPKEVKPAAPQIESIEISIPPPALSSHELKSLGFDDSEGDLEV